MLGGWRGWGVGVGGVCPLVLWHCTPSPFMLRFVQFQVFLALALLVWAMPLKRHAASSGEFVVDRLPCIHCGDPTKAVILPVEVVDKVECVPLGAYATWLHTAVTGKCRTNDGAEVISDFVSAVYDALGGESLLVEEGGESCPNAAASVARAAGGASRGAKALGLSSDDEPEGAAKAAPMPRKRPKNGAARAAAKAWRTVIVRGVELTGKRSARGRGVLVELDSLPAMFVHLRAKVASGELPALRPKAPEQPAIRGDDDKGRITWNFAAHGWVLHYVDADGKWHNEGKGFRVPRSDLQGVLLAGASYDQVRSRVLASARQYWNTVDKSDLPRYSA